MELKFKPRHCDPRVIQFHSLGLKKNVSVNVVCVCVWGEVKFSVYILAQNEPPVQKTQVETELKHYLSLEKCCFENYGYGDQIHELC